MMKRSTIEWIDYITHYIRYNVFTNAKQLTTNLIVMKYNPTFEWFNCARISKSVETDNDIFVNTKEGWENMLGWEIREQEKQEMIRSCVPLLYPLYDPRQRKIEWSLLSTYPLRAFLMDEKPILHHVSAIDKVLQNNKYSSIVSYLKNGWHRSMFKQYLSTFSFYYESRPEMIEYYLKILTISFGANLKIPEEKGDCKIPESCTLKEETVYKNIHELVTTFHTFFRHYLNVLTEMEPRMKEIGYLKETNTYDGLEMLDKLERNEPLVERE